MPFWTDVLKPALGKVTVEPYQLLYMIGSYMSYNAFQDLVYFKVCFNHFHDREMCKDPKNDTLTYVQDQSSYWFRYTSIAEFTPAFLTLCFFGSMSDLKSKKLPLLIPALGAVFSSLFYILISHFENSHVAFCIIPSFITGVCGSFTGITVATMSYLISVCSLEDRTSRIAILEGMTFVGATVGPLIGGALMDVSGHQGIFLFLIVTNTVSFLYVVIRVREVVPVDLEQVDGPSRDKPKKKNRCKRSLEYLYSSLVTCFRRRDNHVRFYVLMLIGSYSSLMFSNEAESQTTYLFLKDEPFKWPFQRYSLYSSVKSGLASFAVLVILPLLRRFLRLKDVSLSMFGFASRVSAALLLTFAAVDAMVFSSAVVGMFRYYPTPVIRSMLSKLVDHDESGRVMTGMALADNIVTLVGSVGFSSLYPVVRDTFHGLCFLISAIFIALAAALVGIVYYDMWRRARPDGQSRTEELSDELAS